MLDAIIAFLVVKRNAYSQNADTACVLNNRLKHGLSRCSPALPPLVSAYTSADRVGNISIYSYVSEMGDRRHDV